MINNISNIHNSDVLEANKKMLGVKNIEKDGSSDNNLLLIIIFVIVIVGIIFYIKYKKDKDDKLLKVKNEDGTTSEISLEFSENEINEAISKLDTV
ncbi:hypothetical protein [Tenacibaculum soleae]|uniref:hypothetical protein n=1 Tax=Tenacibaculum soleae TaxID=447689 RepID=UPI0026E260DA|nr:hypothetical protein [Tenacibaculum soleae]MDO6814071.1 hypothetical protein [Tenacibaculum soleae]